MTNIEYTKKVMELRKKHGFDTQLFLPAYVDILEKEIITNNEKCIECDEWIINYPLITFCPNCGRKYEN